MKCCAVSLSVHSFHCSLYQSHGLSGRSDWQCLFWYDHLEAPKLHIVSRGDLKSGTLIIEPEISSISFACNWCCILLLTILHVEGVGGQTERGAAVVALEAAAVEELPLGAQPLHHVHALSTEEADVAAAEVDGELFSEGALRNHKAFKSVFGGKTGKWENGEGED